MPEAGSFDSGSQGSRDGQCDAISRKEGDAVLPSPTVRERKKYITVGYGTYQRLPQAAVVTHAGKAIPRRPVWSVPTALRSEHRYHSSGTWVIRAVVRVVVATPSEPASDSFQLLVG